MSAMGQHTIKKVQTILLSSTYVQDELIHTEVDGPFWENFSVIFLKSAVLFQQKLAHDDYRLTTRGPMWYA